MPRARAVAPRAVVTRRPRTDHEMPAVCADQTTPLLGGGLHSPRKHGASSPISRRAPSLVFLLLSCSPTGRARRLFGRVVVALFAAPSRWETNLDSLMGRQPSARK